MNPQRIKNIAHILNTLIICNTNVFYQHVFRILLDNNVTHNVQHNIQLLNLKQIWNVQTIVKATYIL